MHGHKYHFLLAVALAFSALVLGCSAEKPEDGLIEQSSNPFFSSINEPVAYADVTAEHLTEYADVVLAEAGAKAEAIRSAETPTFENVVRVFDDIDRELTKASSNSYMLYWVSPDSSIRDTGLAAYKKIDEWNVDFYSDGEIFDRVVAVSENEELTTAKRKLVDDLVKSMQHNGVNLDPESLERYKALNQELNDLTTQYSMNMNSDESAIVVDEAGAAGLPDTFKSRYATDGGYEIPVIRANRGPVLNNAVDENTRRTFMTLYETRAAEENLKILDELVARRHEMAQIMGHDTYADYNLEIKMARVPENVWEFLDDLTARTAEKASSDLERLKQFRFDTDAIPVDKRLQPWDTGYYANSLIKTEYGVDSEEVREYLPMAGALEGMMVLYQELFDLEFRKVDDPSVWHEEVEMYNVYDNDELAGRFYLDLFPRPDKESHMYGVPLTPGGMRPEGREVPTAMLLGNFTRPSDDLPSLITHAELRTLFHEFGHIVDAVSFTGDFALQKYSRADFQEAMSQIFENWIWDYSVVSTFAKHYETGEVLSEEIFESMLAAKNVNSGLGAQGMVRLSTYDMMLYNQYNPDDPMPTDDIWHFIADRFAYSTFIEGTHPQASWIHINTHPVYYYGYLWSRVYAQDLFTLFEENGLRDTDTGKRYRQLILSNGKQRPIQDVVEEFLGRPSNNEAYIRSLGLE
jgi:Zn-dependent oligopeptidase